MLHVKENSQQTFAENKGPIKLVSWTVDISVKGENVCDFLSALLHAMPLLRTISLPLE